MKKRSHKIDKVLKLAASEERRYAEATGASQRRLDEQLARLGELSAYRHNYSRDASSSRATSAAQLKDYQSFLDRLDQAVAAQRQIIRECEQTLERHRRHWQVKKSRLDSLEKVRERYLKDEARAEDRRVQRIADDRRPAPGHYDVE